MLVGLFTLLNQNSRLFSNKDFVLLWFGSAVSRFGDFFGDLALGWIVYQITGSPIAFALNLVISFVPRSVVRLATGVYVDRWNRRNIMIFTEVARGSLFAVATGLNAMGALGVFGVYTVSFFVGMLGALFEVARDALVPSIVGKRGLISANSVLSATLQGTQIAGYALAGAAIFLFGTIYPLAFDSASYFVLVGALLFMSVTGMEGATVSKERWSTQFREGLTYLRERKELLWLAVVVAAINFPLSGLFNIYSLVFSVKALGAGVVGWSLLLTSSTIGYVIGALVVGRIGEPRRKRDLITGSILGMGLFIALLSLTNYLIPALVAIFSFGFFIPFADILITSLYQKVVPTAMRGRVFGVRLFIDYVTAPFGTLAAGILAQFVPITTSMILTGAMCAAVAPFMYAIGSLRKLDLLHPVDEKTD